MAKQYVTMYVKATCDKGCMENCLNVGTDHGVYKVMEGDATYPILNGADQQVNVNISHFGTCAAQGESKCVPKVITPWFDVNEANVLEGSGVLTESSKVACVHGGIISIVSK